MERFLSWFASLFQKRGRGGVIQNYGIGKGSGQKHLIVSDTQLQEARRLR